jgi:hypothetical protein
MFLLDYHLVNAQILILDTFQQIDQNDTINLIGLMGIAYDEDKAQQLTHLSYLKSTFLIRELFLNQMDFHVKLTLKILDF